MKVLLACGAFLFSARAYAFFGSELAPLIQLVTGQVQEIEKMTESIGLAKDQVGLLRQLNDGISRTVAQIESIQAITERSQGLNPRELQSLSELNDLLGRAKGTQAELSEILSAKVQVANQAIERSAIQSDTSYRMGQEMVNTGSLLSEESKTASPGRASQISAAATSAQMLSQGVELQTMAQMVQLQGLLLEFQKSQVEKEIQNEKLRRNQYESQLSVVRRREKR